MRRSDYGAMGAVLLTFAFSAFAQNPPGSASAAAPAEKVTLDSPAKQLSYVIGYQVARNVSERLAQQGVDLDLSAFDVGLRDGLSQAQPQITDEELRAAIQKLQGARTPASSDEAKQNLEAGRKFLAENANQENVVVLASGLQYTVLTPGTGARPKPGATVMVHYRGTLLDGKVFDSSVDRGEPAKFTTDGVIPGFREALTNMREGAKWRIFIPSALAYGERGAGGAIGPNQTLIFELELIEVLSE